MIKSTFYRSLTINLNCFSWNLWSATIGILLLLLAMICSSPCLILPGCHLPHAQSITGLCPHICLSTGPDAPSIGKIHHQDRTVKEEGWVVLWGQEGRHQEPNLSYQEMLPSRGV